LRGSEYATIVETCLRKKVNLENEIVNLAKLSKTQPFPDGNKRSSLIFCNALLLKNNLPLIRIKSHATYAKLLVDYYDDDKKINKFANYVKTNSLKLQKIANVKYRSSSAKK
jgi:Fic family protein